MKVGPLVRAALGPLEIPIAKRYRAFFVDLAQVASAICSAAGPAPDILEVGCGEGALVEELVTRFPGSQITGIDVSARVGRLYRGDRSRVAFERASIEQVARAHPGAYDLIILADVLHHVSVEERIDLLREIRRALRPGGLFVLKDWERNSGLAHALAWFSDRVITGDEVQFLRAPELRALAEGVFGSGCIESELRVGPQPNNLVFFVRDLSSPR